MRKLRGALLGCGMISEFHLRGWQRIPEVEIVALADRSPARAEQRRDQFAPGARVYGDLGAMLRQESLDFLDILTPPALHREHCLMARQAGLHIICQKPLCETLADARDLVREMASYPRLFAIHENHRFRPWFGRVREKLSAGFFGAPALLKIEHLNATGPTVTYKREAERGVWLEYGSHLVDMMRCLLGEPKRVYARMHRLNSQVRGESLVHAVYEYSQATAVVEAGWKSAAITQGSLLLAGPDGEAYYEGSLTRGESARFRLSRGHEVVHDEARRPYEDYVESFYLFQRACADAMLGRSEGVEQTATEQLKTLACTLAAYESAACGGPVQISGEPL